jgi:hypothetical protein
MKNPERQTFPWIAAILFIVAPRTWAHQASPNSGGMGEMGVMMGGGMVLMAAFVAVLIALGIFLVRRRRA